MAIACGITKEHCSKCEGRGALRNSKHFFYGICLVASAAITFFEWPPTPALFQVIWRVCWTIHAPRWAGFVFIWCVTGLPMIFGLAFLYAWMGERLCPQCRGRHEARISEEAMNAISGRE